MILNKSGSMLISFIPIFIGDFENYLQNIEYALFVSLLHLQSDYH